MSQPEERTCFEMMPDGSSKKVVYLHDNLSIIMEDGIIDLQGAKGQGHYDQIMQGIENVNLRFGENFPLRITFDFADGAGHVEYFLAPRVEGDF